jgi:hypothetical protein
MVLPKMFLLKSTRCGLSSEGYPNSMSNQFFLLRKAPDIRLKNLDTLVLEPDSEFDWLEIKQDIQVEKRTFAKKFKKI